MKVDELECNEVWVNVNLVSTKNGWTWMEWGVTLVKWKWKDFNRLSECECNSNVQWKWMNLNVMKFGWM
jgi:hypothetical protein